MEADTCRACSDPAVLQRFRLRALFENCCREFRRQEMRATSNQVLKSARAYMAPVDKKLFADFGRAEISVDTNIVPVRSDTVQEETMYKNPVVLESRLKFKGVMEAATWPSWDAQSVKAQSVLESLLRELCAKNTTAFAGLAWCADVVPVGQFAMRRRVLAEADWLLFVQYKCRYGFHWLARQTRWRDVRHGGPRCAKRCVQARVWFRGSRDIANVPCVAVARPAHE